MTAPVCVCGIGSPFGDDSVGWRAIELLERSEILQRLPSGRIVMYRWDRPGPRLLEVLRGTDQAILIDAILSGVPPGTIRCLPGNALPSTVKNPFAVHGFDLASTLALGAALGELPAQTFVYGVEVSSARLHLPNQALSPPLTASLPKLIKAVEAKLVDCLQLSISQSGNC